MNSDNSKAVPTRRMLKEFASLDDAKGRRRTGMFVAEGTKCIFELAARFTCRHLYVSEQWYSEHAEQALNLQAVPSSRATLAAMTRLTTTPQAIAFFDLPEESPLPDSSFSADNLIVALDRVQDPGNLGTILRTCDWMGVKHIVASHDSVDAFNPKAVQASMGALAHIDISYTRLPEYLAGLSGVDIYGTFLDGDNIYTSPLSRGGILIMGNEGQGISPEVARTITHRLLIPSFPADAPAVESLNVATATAIALSQFRARIFTKS